MKAKALRKSLRLITAGILGLGSLLSAQTGSAPNTVTVNLTAQRNSLVLPDGQQAPMWQFCAMPQAGRALPAAAQ